MPGRDFGPGPYAGGAHMWLGLAFMGLSLLFWLGIPALLVWASLRWIAPRLRGWSAGAQTGFAGPVAQPSAIETLRHRYALGEIDAPTFEQMVERILASEARERQGEQPIAPRDGEIYNT
ncbi:MAG TPA: SHOCT domain-containing protein [Ktedonobacterales bacterium]